MYVPYYKKPSKKFLDEEDRITNAFLWKEGKEYTYDEDQKLSDILLNIRGNFYNLKIEISPPDYDTITGSFEVTVSDGTNSAKGGGINIYDAIQRAKRKLEEEINSNKIQKVEASSVTFVTIPKMQIDASSIKI
jgi:hypothetical protein